jgi:hypothetical protein
MENEVKAKFLDNVTSRFGKLERFGNSRSLFKIQGSDIRLYLRYSKIHNDSKAFYGLRDVDLKQIEGYPSFICFLWENQNDPLIIPYSEYEDVFRSASLADDGQYKALIFFQDDATELYISRAGRFNVDGYMGWEQVEKTIKSSGKLPIPDLSHSQVQTLLGAIGASKDFDVWIPPIDRIKLDWSVAHRFSQREVLPNGYEKVTNILSEVDVVWLQRGGNDIKALFEIEHTTPIYSGLLRFNDIHLTAPNLRARFSIVANNERRALFVRQVNRPTFQTSGLGELCTFFEYSDVFNWHQRLGGLNV